MLHPVAQMSKLAMDFRAKSMGLFQLRNATGLVTTAFLMAVGWWVGHRHPTGSPIALLPFHPPWPFHSWTHGGLTGPLNECSTVRELCLSLLCCLLRAFAAIAPRFCTNFTL
jgi:hypothetical protein